MPAVFLWTFKKGSECKTFFENLHVVEKSAEEREGPERGDEKTE
jgi:hypothetical protein